MLQVGSPAPAIQLPDQDGKTHSLADYVGRKVVLYFYPKDSTAGCTKQAMGFSAMKEQFEAKGAAIIGISKDSVASHRKFADKNNLTITLLSDPELSAIQAYDVWHEKTMCGKTSMGVVRTTYIIDEKGTIIAANDKVKAADNPAQTLALL